MSLHRLAFSALLKKKKNLPCGVFSGDLLRGIILAQMPSILSFAEFHLYVRTSPLCGPISVLRLLFITQFHHITPWSGDSTHTTGSPDISSLPAW